MGGGALALSNDVRASAMDAPAPGPILEIRSQTSLALAACPSLPSVTAFSRSTVGWSGSIKSARSRACNAPAASFSSLDCTATSINSSTCVFPVLGMAGGAERSLAAAGTEGGGTRGETTDEAIRGAGVWPGKVGNGGSPSEARAGSGGNPALATAARSGKGGSPAAGEGAGAAGSEAGWLGNETAGAAGAGTAGGTAATEVGATAAPERNWLQPDLNRVPNWTKPSAHKTTSATVAAALRSDPRMALVFAITLKRRRRMVGSTRFSVNPATDLC